MTATVAIRSPPESPQSSAADGTEKMRNAPGSPASSAGDDINDQDPTCTLEQSQAAPGGYLDAYVDPRSLIILPDGGSGNEYTIYFHDATKAAADSKKMRKLGAVKEDYEAAFDKVSGLSVV